MVLKENKGDALTEQKIEYKHAMKNILITCHIKRLNLRVYSAMREDDHTRDRRLETQPADRLTAMIVP